MVGRFAVALLLAALAGCVADTPAAGSDGGGSAVPHVEVSAGKGALVGLAVDEAVRPLAGVTVALPRVPASVLSGEDGLFAFTDLDPGLYVMEATKPGYDPVQLQVEVAPGDDPPLTKLLLAATPSLQPYIESYAKDMFVTFKSPIIGLGTAFDEAVGQEPAFFQAGLNPTATVIQVEVDWNPGTPTSAHMSLVGAARTEEESVDVGIVDGPSPLLVRANTTAADLVASYFFMRVDPVSLESLDPSGAAIVNQPLRGFAHVFHNFVPDQEWSFVEDGPYPLLR